MNSLRTFYYRVWIYLTTCVLALTSTSLLAENIPLDRIVAVVNDDVIMYSDLQNRMRFVMKDLQSRGGILPPADILEKQVLEKLIQNELQLQFANRVGVTVSEEELQVAVAGIIAENDVSTDEFRQILAEDGYSFERFTEEIRDELLISKLRQQSIASRIIINDREVDNYLVNEKIRSDETQEIRLSHLLIAVPEGATDTEMEISRKLASQVREDILAGKDFAEVAKALSASQTADKGGDLGWLKIGEVPSLFTDYVADMGEGELSEVIESPGGFHLIQMTDIREDEKVMVQQSRVRHILISVDPLTSEEEVRERLHKLRYRITQGEDFEVVAKANSMDAMSAIEGGDLGWRSPGEFVPEFERVVQRLQPGEISDPFRTNYGWHIVQLLERREQDNTESAQRLQARKIIFERKLREQEKEWMRVLREQAYVENRL